MTRTIFFLFIFAASGFLQAQNIDINYIKEREKSLNHYFKTIKIETKDSVKRKVNAEIIKIFDELLTNEETFKYPFDSLFIGKIKAADNSLRIYNWNIVLEDGTHEYFAYLQHFDKKNEMDLFFMNDNKSGIENPENTVLINSLWFGALYYDILIKNHGRHKYYTLLGWDGHNIYTTRKIIDVLYFRNNKPYFGASIFKMGKEVQKRVIFEYAKMATMMLKYNTNINMIVFDHLSPSLPIYKGQPQYYGPDYSFDGFYFDNGKWIYVEDIDPQKAIQGKPSEKIERWKKKNKSLTF